MHELEKRNKTKNTLLLISISTFIFILFRNTGIYPIIFSDEYAYSKLSRLIPNSEAHVPNYLYFNIYSITNSCGNYFLHCAKILNAFFFILSAPFIYLICRSITSRLTSIIIVTLAITGPINSYTAYFMPESLYFLSFWLSIWALLKLSDISTSKKWFTAGCIYGASALIKPHSLFFLPAILIYISYIHFRADVLFSSKPIKSIAFFLGGMILVKLGGGYLLAGPSGLTLFGLFYNSIATSTSTESDYIFEFASLALTSFKGHVLVISLIYGIPAFIALSIVFQFITGGAKPLSTKNIKEIQFEKIIFLSILIILNLICVASLFTASVANAGPYETPYRLHMRYYNFSLPLLYIIAAGAIHQYDQKVKKYVHYIFGFIITIIALYAFLNNISPYTPNFIDSPEARGLHANSFAFKIIGGLLLLTLIISIFFKSAAIKIYIYFSLPMFVAISSYYITSDQNIRKKPDTYDKAGIFTKNHLSDEELSKVIAIGSNPSGLYRSLFHIDNRHATLEVLDENNKYDFSNIPEDKEWLLIFGEHEIADNISYRMQMNGFTLINIKKQKDYIIDFKKEFWVGVISSSKGLSSPEPWGTWSNSETVEFKFSNPLPEKFDLVLIAKAFGPNSGEEVEIHVGSYMQKIKLTDADEKIVIHLKNTEKSNVLQIKIPYPTSPKALGLSGDERNLGVGLVEMRIIPTQ